MYLYIVRSSYIGVGSSISVGTYTEHLKEQYLKQHILPDDPWPPSMGQHYINLALIEHSRDLKEHSDIQGDLLRGKIDKILHGQKRNVDINKAFENCHSPTNLKILIDGAPGVGKTTLCRKICYDWAKGELLEDYPMLIYIPLRVAKLARASHIEKLFYHDDPDVESAVVKHNRKTGGADVMFLFDGYDELSRRERERESLFLDIFNGRVLQKCSVIICSRPYASQRLQRLSTLTRHIEVLGFNKEQIEECMKSGIPDSRKAENLIDELSNRQDLLSFCYIPLNCAILIYVYKVTNYTIPNTITELFTLFINNTFQRQKDIHLIDKTTLKKHKSKLAELSHQSLLEDKLAFEEEEVPSSEEARLGLMTAAKYFTSSGIVISYQFTHLTVHEYLAAEWMANCLSEKEQAEFLDTNLEDDRFRMVFIFLAGLTKLQSEHYINVLSSKRLQLSQDVYYTSSYYETDKKMRKHFNLFLHLTYESQSPQACCALAKSIEDQMIWYDLPHGKNFELSILGYFISQSDCLWENISLTVYESRSNFICFDRFVEPFQSASPKTSIKRFSLKYHEDKHNGGSPLPKVLWTLFATSAFRDLRCIEAFQSSTAIANYVSWYDGPSSECNKMIIKHLKNLQHIELDGIGLNHEVVKNSLIPIISNCRKTIKTLVLTGKLQLDEWCPCLSIDSLFDFCKLIHPSLFPVLERIQLDIGPIPIYPPSEDAFKLLHMTYTMTTTLFLRIKTLKSLTLKGEFLPSNCYRWTLMDELASVDYLCRKKQLPNLFILMAATAKNLKYLNLNTFFLFNCTRGELCRMLTNNNCLTTFNLTIDYYVPSARVLEQLAQGMKHNSGLKKLIVSLWQEKPKDVRDESCYMENARQLLRNMNSHPTLNTLVLKAFEFVFDFNELSRLLLRNSRITTLGVKVEFPRNKIKCIAQGLVLNARRTEFYFFSGRIGGHDDKDTENVQSDVDEFKDTCLLTMFKTLSHLLIQRQTSQTNFLNLWTSEKEFTETSLLMMVKLFSQLLMHRQIFQTNFLDLWD